MLRNFPQSIGLIVALGFGAAMPTHTAMAYTDGELQVWAYVHDVRLKDGSLVDLSRPLSPGDAGRLEAIRIHQEDFAGLDESASTPFDEEEYKIRLWAFMHDGVRSDGSPVDLRRKLTPADVRRFEVVRIHTENVAGIDDQSPATPDNACVGWFRLCHFWQ